MVHEDTANQHAHVLVFAHETIPPGILREWHITLREALTRVQIEHKEYDLFLDQLGNRHQRQELAVEATAHAREQAEEVRREQEREAERQLQLQQEHEAEKSRQRSLSRDGGWVNDTRTIAPDWRRVSTPDLAGKFTSTATGLATPVGIGRNYLAVGSGYGL